MSDQNIQKFNGNFKIEKTQDKFTTCPQPQIMSYLIAGSEAQFNEPLITSLYDGILKFSLSAHLSNVRYVVII